MNKQKSENEDLSHLMCTPKSNKQVKQKPLIQSTQDDQENTSATTGASSRRSRKERAEQRAKASKADQGQNKDSYHSQGQGFSQSGRRPRTSTLDTLTVMKKQGETPVKSIEENRASMRNILTRMDRTQLRKFDEFDSKITSVQKQIEEKKREFGNRNVKSATGPRKPKF